MKLVAQELVIHAPADQLYKLLVDPELFVLWMADDADPRPRPGRHPSAGATQMGTPAREPTSSSFPVAAWCSPMGGSGPRSTYRPGSTTVEIDLLPQPDGSTLLKLVHRGLDDLAADAHHRGWTHYLDRLRTAAEGVSPGPDPFADRRVPTPQQLANP